MNKKEETSPDGLDINAQNITTTTSIEEGTQKFVGADPALQFVRDETVTYTPEEERKVLRKIDWHILPLLAWVYAIQFADKSTLNFSSLMGIRTDTHLDPKSQQYSWVASIFYAGYILWEFPTTYLLRRLPVGKYTSFTILFWGIVLSCTAAASNYAGLLTIRFFLGALESTVTPAFVIYTGMWYKQNEQARRMGYWLGANGLATIVMSGLAYGLSAVHGTLIASWQILFLLMGLLTVVTGTLYIFFMPDTQINAKFLTHRERHIAVERIRVNFQGVGNNIWKWSQFREAFRDPRTYLYALYSLLMNIPNGGITTFGAIVISSFGFDARNSLLLGMPGGAIDFCAKLIFPWISDRFMDRTGPAFAAILLPMIGGILMITVPLEHKGALLFGNYLISFSGASWGLVMVMISNNTLGYTKKATVSGIQITAYAAGNWIGPQTFRSWDAPDYKVGKTLVAIMYGLAALTLVAIRVVNILENRRRDKRAAEFGDVEVMDSEFLDLTDFEQPRFRYIL